MADKRKTSLTDTVQQHTFRVLCSGRDEKQRPALGLASDDLVSADVVVRLRTQRQILSRDVNCQYNCGSRGEKCCAAGKGDMGICHYSIDLPYPIDNQLRRQLK